jgi:hypothetical protein
MNIKKIKKSTTEEIKEEIIIYRYFLIYLLILFYLLVQFENMKGVLLIGLLVIIIVIDLIGDHIILEIRDNKRW